MNIRDRRLYNKEYRKKNREKLVLNSKKYNKEYCKNNKEELRLKKKAWYEENREQIKGSRLRHYVNNKEAISKKRKDKRDYLLKTDKDALLKKEHEEYLRRDKKKIAEYRHRYQLEHKKELSAKKKKKWPFVKYAVAKRLRFKNYGISDEEYVGMLKEQNNSCAVCKTPFKQITVKGKHGLSTKTSCSVDHNHKTGKVRKLLCNRCNTAIGMIDDSPLLAKRIFYYLLSFDNDLNRKDRV